MQWPTISDDPVIQANYEEARVLGTSHTLAEMFALAVAPGANTDTSFLSGHCNGNQFEGQDDIADEYKREAEAAGVSTNGKVYKSGLARFPGDPEAWITGKADVVRICEKRGWGAEGSVDVKMPDVPKGEEIAVADSIIDREVAQIAASVPDSARVDREDLRQQVVAKRRPYWAKK